MRFLCLPILRTTKSLLYIVLGYFNKNIIIINPLRSDSVLKMVYKCHIISCTSSELYYLPPALRSDCEWSCYSLSIETEGLFIKNLAIFWV